MKIARDGKEYELTRAELVQAFEELREINFKNEIEFEIENFTGEYEKFSKWCKHNSDGIEEIKDDALYECLRRQEALDNEPVDDFVRNAVWDSLEDYFHLFNEGEDGYEVYEEMF